MSPKPSLHLVPRFDDDEEGGMVGDSVTLALTAGLECEADDAVVERFFSACAEVDDFAEQTSARSAPADRGLARKAE